jgi:anaerobic selenocysteine-containing dehydrogenase
MGPDAPASPSTAGPSTASPSTAGPSTAGHPPAGTDTHVRTCPLCEATCGLELTVEHDGAGGGDVRLVRGDRNDVFSHGYLCAKGSALGRLHADPDRLRRPLVRRGTPDDPRFEEVSWEEAFATVERLLTGVLDTHGRNAVAIYLGNPNVHNPAAALYTRPLVRALATPNIFSASTVDQMPRHVSSGLMFGHPDAIAVPDLDRTDYLLMLGANPLESNGSLCTAPDFAGRLEAIRNRGGRVVVVDPRRTRTADVADEHVFIRPGTDAVLLVGLVRELYTTGAVDPGRLAEWLDGVDELAAHVEPFTPAHVEAVTGVPAATVRRLAAELAAAPTAVVYGRIGTTTVAFGTVASWATDVLGALTGNLDAPGGAMFPLAAHNRPGPGRGRGFSVGRRHSRVRGFPEVRGEFPVATLATEITTPGDGQVRALITVAGNPVLSTPESEQLAGALATLECMVSVDPYLNETTRFAHVVLPPPSALERCHYDLAFTGLSVRNVANFSPALFEPTGPAENEILARLALIAAGAGAEADPAVIDALVLDALLGRAVADDSPLAGRDPADLAAQLTGDGPVERALDAMVRTGAYGDWFGAVPDGLSLQVLVDNPHGVDLGPLEPRIPEVLRTPTGRVDLVPEAIVADLERLAGVEPGVDDDEALLVGRRHVRSNNSWMHNIEVLVKGRPRCTLQVHPDDAARWGLTDGEGARVTSRVGEVVAPVECTDAIMPGVVSLPHGWGHDDPNTALGVAATRPGVNSNVLTDAEAIDPLSGTSVLNGIPVRVRPAA